MTQNVDRETVVSRLLAADDILILCHKNPDGDTIGSGTALCRYNVACAGSMPAASSDSAISNVRRRSASGS